MAICKAPQRVNQLLVQGIALGIKGKWNFRPARAKASYYQMLLPLQGGLCATIIPRAMPWADCSLAFQAAPY